MSFSYVAMKNKMQVTLKMLKSVPVNAIEVFFLQS